MALVTNREDAHTIGLHVNAARVVLDCGHLATPDYYLVPGHRRFAGDPGQGVSGSSGYATTLTGERICYADADIRQRADMRAAGAAGEPFAAYVSGDDTTVTTWTGGVLGTISQTGLSRAGWHGSEIHSYRVTDADGHGWYGRNGGPGMVILLRPNKRA